MNEKLNLQIGLPDKGEKIPHFSKKPRGDLVILVNIICLYNRIKTFSENVLYK